jgi:hypothetical protein
MHVPRSSRLIMTKGSTLYIRSFRSLHYISCFLAVLSNPIKRQEYDKKGVLYVQDQNAAVSTPSPTTHPLTHLPEHKNIFLMTHFNFLTISGLP